MITWLNHLRPESVDPLSGAASSPEIIAATVAEIGFGATAWAVEAARVIVADVEHEFRSAGMPGMMTGSEREGCEACLLTTLVGLHRGTPAKDIVAPEGAKENVRLSVRQGVPIGDVLRTVWACHTQAQDALLAVLGRDVPSDRLVLDVRELNAALFSYVNSYVRDLMAGYEDELSLWHGRLPAERLRVLTALLAGEEPAEDAEHILGQRLSGHHLFGLAWPAANGHIPDRESAMNSFGLETGQILGAAGTLIFQREGTTQFWWTFKGPPPDSYLDIIRAAPQPAWISLAVGRPGRGLSGLRESHFAAQQAARVGMLNGSDGFWPYEKVALLALMVADSQAAGRFVRSELAGLMGAEQKLIDIRETLRHFLAAGSSRIAAAEALHLATSTVAYRVRRAGELLGRGSHERTLNTLMALELAHMFPRFMQPDNGMPEI